jgi:hypothetical protein
MMTMCAVSVHHPSFPANRKAKYPTATSAIHRFPEPLSLACSGSHSGRGVASGRLSIALLMIPVLSAGAQMAAGNWRGWAFGRVGAAAASKADLRGNTLLSLGVGVAASHGALLGMVRANDIEPGSFEDNAGSGITDYSALVGARSPGERLFVTAAAGIGQSSQHGTLNSSQLVPAFDLSAHADYRFVGVAFTVSGVLGPSSTRYIAISLGAELGRLGLR